MRVEWDIIKGSGSLWIAWLQAYKLRGDDFWPSGWLFLEALVAGFGKQF